jgi:hypothetical protein
MSLRSASLIIKMFLPQNEQTQILSTYAFSETTLGKSGSCGAARVLAIYKRNV